MQSLSLPDTLSVTHVATLFSMPCKPPLSIPGWATLRHPQAFIIFGTARQLDQDSSSPV